MNRLSLGHVVAFFIVLACVLGCWSLVFTKGGIGANIVLGVLIAIWFTSAATNRLSRALNIWVFYKGSRERMKKLFQAQDLLDQHKDLLSMTSHKQSPSTLRQAQQSYEHLQEYVDFLQRTNPTAMEQVNEEVQQLSQRTKQLHKDVKKNLLLQEKSHWHGMIALGGALAAALLLRVCVIETYQIPSGSMIPTLQVGDHLFVSKLSYGLLKPFGKGYWVQKTDPQPGDVIIFTAPNHVGHLAGQTWIKRVIATAGQKVRIKDSVVYVNDKPYPHVQPSRWVNYDNYNGQQWQFLQAEQTVQRVRTGKQHSILLPSSGPSSYLQSNWPQPNTRLPGLKCSWDSCYVRPGHVFVMGDNRGNSADGRVWGALKTEAIKGKALFIWMSVNGSQQMLEWGPFAFPQIRWRRLGMKIE